MIATRHLERHPNIIHQLTTFFEMARKQRLEVFVIHVASDLQWVTSAYGTAGFEVSRAGSSRVELTPLPAMLQQRAISSLLPLDPQRLVTRPVAHDRHRSSQPSFLKYVTSRSFQRNLSI